VQWGCSSVQFHTCVLFGPSTCILAELFWNRHFKVYCVSYISAADAGGTKSQYDYDTLLCSLDLTGTRSDEPGLRIQADYCTVL
jgi:hypothetical protein